jgi:signal transduction histidine kinase
MRGTGLDRVEPRRRGEAARRAGARGTARAAGEAAGAARAPDVSRSAASGPETRLSELARRAPGVILSLGRNGVILDVSAPLAGRPEDYWRGRCLPDLLGVADARPIASAVALLERGARAREVIVPLEAPDGDMRLYRFCFATIAAPGRSGAPVASAFVSDITDQIAEERALSEREALLARRHKSAMLAYLAGGVAHDLNNLLTVIVGAADLLGEAPDETDDDGDLRAELAQIRRAGGRASEMTRQLLAFSRREPTVPLVLNLETCVRELGPLLARLLGPGIRLELSFQNEPWLVRLDPLHAEHVITHLVLYARQTMPHGGVLWVSLANLHVERFERRGGLMIGPGEYVQLTVRDTGCGLGITALERAFEPFFAAEDIPGSTDLTLPLVRHMVAHAFGHIWLESEVGRGTVVHVLFPRYDERRPSAPPRHRPEVASRVTPPATRGKAPPVRNKARRRRAPRRRSPR